MTSSSSPEEIVSPNDHDHSPKPKTRSCESCAEKKIKCDKSEPCSNCKRHRTKCVFPPPGRVRRKMKYSSGAHKKDLQRRLELMEQALQEMRNRETQPAKNVPLKAEPVSDLDSAGTPGTLIYEAGQSRYVSNDSALWAAIMEEMDDLKEMVTSTSDPGSPDNQLPVQVSGKHQGFMFGFSSLALDLSSLHPPPTEIPTYWQHYITNVDPVVKIFHTPSFITQILSVTQYTGQLNRPVEAAIFAIYYAVVISMTPKEVMDCFSEERSVLLERYEFGVEQALARADFLSTRDIVTLQAFALYLITCPYDNDNGVARNLTGNLIRSAQSIGIHRECTGAGISPFDVEMRRRLWWNICELDFRTSEDHGIEPMISDSLVLLPANLDDADLHPDMTNTPQSRVGLSDMTLSLVKFRLAQLIGKMGVECARKSNPNSDSLDLHLESRIALIKETEDAINANIRAHGALPEDEDRPACELVGRTMFKLMINKAWLLVYHPLRMAENGKPLSLDMRIFLFTKAVEILECSQILETAPTIKRWAWKSRTYVQWHAIAFILANLCCPQGVRPVDEGTIRAWRVLYGIFKDWGDDPNEQRCGQLWLPMRKLKNRVMTIWEDQHKMSVCGLQEGAPAVTQIAQDFFPDYPSDTKINATAPILRHGTAEPRVETSQMPLDTAMDMPLNGMSYPPDQPFSLDASLEKAPQSFNFMPMLFDLVDSSAPEDLGFTDSETWNQTEQYFNLELDRLGQIY